jgi:hypothetical protein
VKAKRKLNRGRMSECTLHLIEAQETRMAKECRHEQRFAMRGKDLPARGGGLLTKYFEHGFALGFVHLRQGLGDERTVLGTAVVEHLREAERGVAHEDLGVFEAFVVFRDAQVHFASDRLDLFEEIRRFVHVAGSILLETELGHLVDEFGVEEALLAGLSLGNSGLEGGNAVLVDELIVGGRRVRRDGKCCDSKEDGRPSWRPHKEPPLKRNWSKTKGPVLC